MIYKRTDAQNDVTQAVIVFCLQNGGKKIKILLRANENSEMVLVQPVEEISRRQKEKKKPVCQYKTVV